MSYPHDIAIWLGVEGGGGLDNTIAAIVDAGGGGEGAKMHIMALRQNHRRR